MKNDPLPPRALDPTGAPSQAVTRAETRLHTLTSPGPFDQETVSERMPSTSHKTISTLLASPRSVMVLVPLLVLTLGATLTITGQLALGATSRKMARDRFIAHTTAVAQNLESTLGQAEPLLDELTRVAREVRPDPSAPLENSSLALMGMELRDLMVGRSGVTQVYLAYQDGTFLSVDPETRETLVEKTGGGKTTIFRLSGQSIAEVETNDSDYDPRTRRWYQDASRGKKRTWSPPYTFFFTNNTGVTRSEPLFDPKSTTLVGVVGVDFNVDTLTSSLEKSRSAADQGHIVVFTGRGVVLAYPQDAERLEKAQRGHDVAMHEDLGDPALSALVRQVQTDPKVARSGELLRFGADGTQMFASVRRLSGGGPDWYVATYSPQTTVLRDLISHRKSSLLVGTLSLLLAVCLSWFLARRLHQVSRAARIAHDVAEAARSRARELGSYRLVSRIGEGGMGEVWKASHRLLARHAAIKLIKPGPTDAARSREQRERFRREAQAIAGLRSRNTVALFDYGITPDGTLFYVMELLDGIDLNTLVHEFGPLPAERVRSIMIQACNSLAEAHSVGLVHRDIKPANLVLCREAEEVDVVKVLDFGLVFQALPLPQSDLAQAEDASEPDLGLRTTLPGHTSPLRSSATIPPADPTLAAEVPILAADRITQAEHQLGTPAFMSPEQALGTDTDGRSDLYSLACVAFFLLTGKTPFSADSSLGLLVKHIEETPPRLSDAMKNPPAPDFERLILSCLEKSPGDRPGTAEILRQRLRDLGRLSPDFSPQDAEQWWRDHRGLPEVTAEHQLAPLRDADLIVEAR